MARPILLLLLALMMNNGTFAKDAPHRAMRSRTTTVERYADAEVLRVKNNSKNAPARKNVQRTTVRRTSA